MTARVIPVDPFDLVVFGATGDLAQRKLLPALYHRDAAGQLPDGARILDRKWGAISLSDIKEGHKVRVFGTIADTIVTAKTVRDISIN